MALRQISASVLALSLASSFPTLEAQARGGEALVGGIIGGIIGGAIVNEAQKQKRAQPQAKVAPRKAAPDPARQERRSVQAALNYFGFNAGTPDGVYGRNTRLAVAQYQASLGYPTTGELTAFQQKFLLESHLRAEAGGATTLAEISRTPGGAAGMLASWHDDMTRPPSFAAAAPQPQPLPAAPAPVAGLAPGAGGGAPFLPKPPAAAAPAPMAAPGVIAAGAALAPVTPSLPSFQSTPPAQASLTSHCNQVSMVTGTNGGFATLASMTDPAQALDEQFCLARTYAITDGEALAAGIKGVTTAQLNEQCAAFGPVMAAPVALLATQGTAQVIPAAVQVGAGTGMSPAQLIESAKICLSAGYRTDNMGVALGSVLLLAAQGELPYAELVGHHLMKGFGAGTNPTLARDWFRISVDAVANGRAPVFNPGQPERVQLIRALVFGERPAPTPAPVAAGTPSPLKLPGFSTNN